MSFNNLVHKLLCFVPILFASTSSDATTIQLQSGSDSVLISPQTLAINWNNLVINQAALNVEQKSPQSYRLITQSNSHATWQVLPSKLRISASLQDNELSVSLSLPHQHSVSRQNPIDVEWFNLDNNLSQTLYLPFSEGMRVPLANSDWTNFLIENYSGSNTTQDLKMPFWTVEQNGHFISYLLTTPTNNRLTFADTHARLDMSAEHQFTQLNTNQPFTFQVTLGDTPLSGALSYRQWRQQTGVSESLSEKLNRNPELEKLIGASHVYLFGKDALSTHDVKDWRGLNHWYLTKSSLSVPSDIQRELSNIDKQQDWFSQYYKQLLIDAISDSLNDKFKVGYPTLANNTIADQYHSAQSIRRWLIEHAGHYLVPAKQWGQALSSDMLNSFQQAGLSRLWLGFDNWMPSFYHPEINLQAQQHDYLVGVYDSYNTAITQGSNDGWLTANLPDAMRLDCAIELATGKKKTGFRGHGFYLNPNCQLDYVKQRMLDIAHYGRFNSIFLDVDATAMAREDYRDGTDQAAMLAAFNHRLSWLSKQPNIVLGSEDGNSLTSTGMAFAHGLETVGFGWVDGDMTKNSKSEYYLGRWYPDHKPDYFFKSAKVKQPYRTLLFAPQYRVPLYQAVFHDEIINSHHWHSDSLKFSNVKVERDLTAMLYNTPPMVHLTRDEALSANSPRIKQLKHYQSGFAPIHQQIWNQAMTNFSWLDKEGYIQQTTFADGSILTANFSKRPYKLGNTQIAAQSIYAKLSNHKELHWTPK